MGTATETVHHDLGAHMASYFVTEQVVRRARTNEESVDPRQQGEVIAWTSG
jgi:hypothetical protein